MAIPINIEDLLNKRKVESNRIELKTGWNPQSIYHTICAFANDLDNLGGGYILVGVEEENGIAKRPVKGLPIEQLDKIQKDMVSYNNLIEPFYAPRISVEEVDGQNILAIWVPSGTERPYTAPENVTAKLKKPVFYVRYGTSSIEAKEELLGRGRNPDNMIEAPVIKGTVPYMIKATLDYLRTNVIKERIIKVPDRQEPIKFFNYPYAALEESVTNALYHRAYKLYEPVEITIEPDRISILSHSGPDRSISKEAIRQAKSLRSRRYKNRRLGDFLKELGLTEGRATGIPTIQAALEANGSPRAVIETDDDRTFFLIDIPCHPAFKGEPLYVKDQKDDHVDGVLVGHLKDIYFVIKDNPNITIKQIADIISIKERRAKYLIDNLKTKGFIKRKGRGNGYWIILK